MEFVWQHKCTVGVDTFFFAELMYVMLPQRSMPRDENGGCSFMKEMGRKDMKKAVADLKAGKRPPLPVCEGDRQCEAYLAIIEACWQSDPADRPSMTSVIKGIDAALLI